MNLSPEQWLGYARAFFDSFGLSGWLTALLIALIGIGIFHKFFNKD